ncbi:alanine-phosphoribitol ligase [Gordoniibacillus kamchatkensis]|uniref:D-alanine--D-alanyl carrier protein ligase n=1 Tax=Gordoniibacillus kamchatkensis TaxID=1590651 RepID=A0ABR5AK02_9BACL|nr:D-alanine--poly(phosphoribitol) ligase subunit DltA [Paenibacillus sp. VKM B-2647]KIL41344.1 alanine-phosphoribitol ligase [Paenibacillus sp. VKM B-2647]
MDILQKVAHWAKHSPDHPAYLHRSKAVTYRQLEEYSDALAFWLESNGSSGRPVIVYGHMQPEMPIAFLACAKAGRAYIPVDDSTPPARLSSILKHADAELLLSVSGLPGEIDLLSTSVVTDIPGLIRSNLGRCPDPKSRVAPDDNFYIIYTSGSTGEPKGVQIPLRCLQAFLGWIEAEFGERRGDIFINQAPYSFDLSVMDLYPALSSGGTVNALDRNHVAKPAELFAALNESGATVWTSTPSFAEFCLNHPEFGQTMLPRLHTFRFCGEVLTPSCAKRLQERFPAAAIYNTYGPTEATVAVTSVRIDPEMASRYPELPVGRCKPDCQIRIADERGTPVPEGENGEIVILGASVSPGYYRNPEQTKAAFFVEKDKEQRAVQGYRTGDSGYVRNGILFYGGRLDYQVKLHGYRVEPEEIEHQLRRLTGIKTAVVVPKMNGRVCEYLTAFVVPEAMPDSEFAWSMEIKKKLSQSLPAYMVPRRFVAKELLPVTANGKADRKKLAEEV